MLALHYFLLEAFPCDCVFFDVFHPCLIVHFHKLLKKNSLELQHLIVIMDKISNMLTGLKEEIRQMEGEANNEKW